MPSAAILGRTQNISHLADRTSTGSFAALASTLAISVSRVDEWYLVSLRNQTGAN
jgi:hypothetical protein